MLPFLNKHLENKSIQELEQEGKQINKENAKRAPNRKQAIYKGVLKKKEFARKYVENEFNGTKAAQELRPNLTKGSASSLAYRLAKDPIVKAEVKKLMELELGIDTEYVKARHLVNSLDENRSERSQDHNLQKLGEVVGAYKTQEESNFRVLNVTNVMNLVSDASFSHARGVLEQDEIELLGDGEEVEFI